MVTASRACISDKGTLRIHSAGGHFGKALDHLPRMWSTFRLPSATWIRCAVPFCAAVWYSLVSSSERLRPTAGVSGLSGEPIHLGSR